MIADTPTMQSAIEVTVLVRSVLVFSSKLVSQKGGRTNRSGHI